MAEITTQTHIGIDGVMHLEIPTDLKDADVNVTVKIMPTSELGESSAQERQEWLDFIDRTAGAWQGDFKREQGTAEERNWPIGFYGDENHSS